MPPSPPIKKLKLSLKRICDLKPELVSKSETVTTAALETHGSVGLEKVGQNVTGNMSTRNSRLVKKNKKIQLYKQTKLKHMKNN